MMIMIFPLFAIALLAVLSLSSIRPVPFLSKKDQFVHGLSVVGMIGGIILMVVGFGLLNFVL
jgi:hypothetical protein